MGMAASQARYLEITARKTDVEYQGQQINQARTNLANESAGMFSQLMGLIVPTPPSTTDYTTTTYTFNDGSNESTITNVTSLAGDPNYNATVSYYYTQSVYTAVAKTRTDMGVNLVTTPPPDSTSTYWLTNGTTNQTKLTQCSASDSDIGTDKAALLKICQANPDSTFALTDLHYDAATQTIGTIGGAYKYKDASGLTHYYGNTALNAASLLVPSGRATSLTGYYATNLDTKINQTEKAYITKTESGRYSTIQLASEGGTTLDVNATTTTDQNAYNNAMNEYTYQQQVYEQQVNDINAKTEVIQQQDKKLELQLKQLDTEQQALSTEMEAVKKVIDKNIEQTFKTFAS